MGFLALILMVFSLPFFFWGGGVLCLVLIHILVSGFLINMHFGDFIIGFNGFYLHVFFGFLVLF